MTKDEAITILSDSIPSAGPKREALETLMSLMVEMENDLDHLDPEAEMRNEILELRNRLWEVADHLADMGLLTNTPKAKFDFVWGRS